MQRVEKSQQSSVEGGSWEADRESGERKSVAGAVNRFEMRALKRIKFGGIPPN